MGMTSFPGTRYYKAPEMFLHYRRYDFAVDVWSFATVMAMLVSGRHPFFPVNYPATNFGQMMGIVAFTGLDAYEALLDKYDFPQDYVVKYHPSIFHEMKIPGGRVVWNSLRNRQNKTRPTRAIFWTSSLCSTTSAASLQPRRCSTRTLTRSETRLPLPRAPPPPRAPPSRARAVASGERDDA